MQSNTQLTQGSTLVLGLGQTGLAVARYLHEQKITFAVMDTRGKAASGVEQLNALAPNALLEWDEACFCDYERLIVSPGISIHGKAFDKAREHGVAIIGDIELFAQVTDLPIIAITGSNGKSTVTELVGYCLEAEGYQPFVGGNIGVPVMELLTCDDYAQANLAVLELSSFQLETTSSLQATAATVLNVSPDHLDRYESYQDYAAAKQSIYEQARSAVVNADDATTQVNSEQAPSVLSFGLSETADWQVSAENQTLVRRGKAVLNLSELSLQGTHNALNVAACFALLEACGIDISERILAAAKNYQGLPHRCQKVAEIHGVSFIDDSKATNVGATLAALESFNARFGKQIILIAGGDAKGAELNSLHSALNSIKATIAFGKDKQQLAEISDKVELVDTLKEAVQRSAELAESGDLVLLSPACASLDMFRNYQERGHQFQAFVRALA